MVAQPCVEAESKCPVRGEQQGDADSRGGLNRNIEVPRNEREADQECDKSHRRLHGQTIHSQQTTISGCLLWHRGLTESYIVRATSSGLGHLKKWKENLIDYACKIVSFRWSIRAGEPGYRQCQDL